MKNPYVPEAAVVEAYVAVSFVPSNVRPALSVRRPPVVANVRRPEVRLETESAVDEAKLKYALVPEIAVVEAKFI